MIALTEDKRMLGYDSLQELCPDIFHFITTRYGGCGRGSYGTFNCSPFAGDDVNVVRENQKRLFQGMPWCPASFIVPHQTHGVESLVVDAQFLRLDAEEQRQRLEGIDALITDVPSCCICVSTADCVPIILIDVEQKVIAVVHAGWRGTQRGILERTLLKMYAEFGTQSSAVYAYIGPSISKESFEVGDEVYHAFAFEGYDMDTISYRNVETGKFHVDLWETNVQQLCRNGVPKEQIELAGICTYQHPDEFFSARRLGLHSGRILSGIMLK